jgi:PAS domain S-box-containing protein
MGSTSLATRIEERLDAIVERWKREVRAAAPTEPASEPALVDSLPSFLRELVGALRRLDGVTAEAVPAIARAHGRQRFRLGTRLEDVVREYEVLRATLFAVVREAAGADGGAPTLAELEVLTRELGRSMAEAAMQYGAERERELARSQAALQSLVDHASPAIYLKDAEGRYLVVNRAWEEASGVPRERALGRTSQEVLPEATARAVVASDAQVLAANGPVQEEVAHQLPSAPAPTHFFSVKFPLRDAEGRAFAVGGISTDVTARKRLEGALRESDERFRLLVEGVQDHALIFLTPEGAVASWNRAAERVLGYGEQEALGLPLQAFYTPEAQAAGEPAECLRMALETGRQTAEGVRVRKDGTPFWADVTVTALRDEGGRLRGFAKLARDVSQRRAAEAARDETLALLDALIADAPVGLAFYDTGLRYFRVNHALAAINGRPVEAHLGRPIREVLPEVAPQLEALLRVPLEEGRAVLGLELSGPNPARPGETAHWMASFSPVRDAEGRTFMVAAVVVDVTELKRAEQELQRTAEFRERLVGIVSHDLRTPLAAISAGAGLLQRLEDLPERAVKPARRIADSALRMGRMISELLDFTRARLGEGLQVQRTPGDLAAIVETAVDEAEMAYAGRHVTLEVQGALWGEWDGDRLSQVVQNLVTNALDYSPPTAPVTVRLSGEEAGWVSLAVHNANLAGPIPPDLLANLFDPFRRGHEGVTQRRREGLGLGLFIAHEAVRAHGGTITVTSSEEEGTVFRVRLPRRG